MVKTPWGETLLRDPSQNRNLHSALDDVTLLQCRPKRMAPDWHSPIRLNGSQQLGLLPMLYGQGVRQQILTRPESGNRTVQRISVSGLWNQRSMVRAEHDHLVHGNPVVRASFPQDDPLGIHPDQGTFRHAWSRETGSGV